MKKVLTIGMFAFSIATASAQKKMKMKLYNYQGDSLEVYYKGELTDGKANGKGKAIDTDYKDEWYMKVSGKTINLTEPARSGMALALMENMKGSG